MNHASVPLVIVPGWQDSGPGHWQSLWQRDFPDGRRVQQTDWQHPQPDDWVDALDRVVRACPSPPVLIGHSLGCIAIARWAMTPGAQARGAFLVAPADVEAGTTPPEIAGFAPIPGARLPFASLLFASRNDPYASFQRARQFADYWGSGFVDLGMAGHINADAGFGPWPQGRALLEHFMAQDAGASEQAPVAGNR